MVDAKALPPATDSRSTCSRCRTPEGGRLAITRVWARLRETIVKTLAGEIQPDKVFAKRGPEQRNAAFS